MALDIIFIQGLKINAIIGVYDWEKQFKQPLIFDLSLSTD
ncbi:MAG: dihydroneopterin aldolase, partial [Hydrogenovibrio crunogenus]|nr:dihydroneopterin aldolase [Hydrogenovibrio crunogenus]